MKVTIFLISLVFTSLAFAKPAPVAPGARDEALLLKPANEYCFVTISDENDKLVDRKEIRFPLDSRDPKLTRFKTEIDVDQDVKATIVADVAGYSLSIFRNGSKDRPLGTGFYNRTAVIDDFNSTGFYVYTEKASYGIACITESYIN